MDQTTVELEIGNGALTIGRGVLTEYGVRMNAVSSR